LNSIFDLDAALRRVRPDRRRQRLAVRTPVALLPDDVDPLAVGPVLLDTCVFIDIGHDTLPLGARRLLAARGLVHVSSVTGMELASAFGRLDPADPRTAGNLRYLREVLARAPRHRVVNALPADHAMAGVLAGTLTRTQGLDRDARRRLLFDCLILTSARRNGLTVLTANHQDFDLLLQLVTDAKVAFYRPDRSQ
jgi:predicted nucleic acid-binding protein